MKPPAFAYHRVASAEEAVERVASLGDEAKILAGGQSLVPMMSFGLVRPTALVDVSRVPGLAYLRRDGDALAVGALTTHRTIELAVDELADGFALLPRTARWIGHYPIRTRGTIGGSLAHADSAAEWCLLAVLLDAQIAVLGPGGARTVAAADFFRGYFTTALDPDELVTEIRFPRPWRHAALQEFARRHGDFAIAAAAVALDLDGGTCRAARVAVGSVAGVPLRRPEAEAVLTGARLDGDAVAEAAAAAAAGLDPPSDVHGSGAYRRELVEVLVRRALAEAARG